MDVAHNVTASGHIALAGVGLGDVDYAVKEIRFAMLAAEVPAENIIVVREMCLAVLAAVDARGVQVDVVGQTHGCRWYRGRGRSEERGSRILGVLVIFSGIVVIVATAACYLGR